MKATMQAASKAALLCELFVLPKVVALFGGKYTYRARGFGVEQWTLPVSSCLIRPMVGCTAKSGVNSANQGWL